MFHRRLSVLISIIVVLILVQGCAGDPSDQEQGQVGSGPGGEQVAAAASSTDTATPAPATFTPIPTITSTPTPGPSSTPTITLTPSSTPTDTPVPTATPTSEPQSNPLLANYGTPEKYLTATPPTPIPTPVPRFEMPSGVTNVLLLGSDNPIGSGVGNTDTIIIASINRETKTASMVSLPRDLYVYIPGRTMHRINTAMPLGGVQLLKDTILYNFGVPIHYYARIDFQGFETVVDAIGGVDVPVSCSFEDHRLISPDLDPEDEDSWELYRVDPGIVHMDGETALWYVRSREAVESDWGRSKRQQQVLRAILNKGVDVNLLPEIPSLYNTYRDTVDTDLDIGRILQMATLAPAVRDNGMQQLYIVGDQLQPWAVPDAQPPMNVQLPRWENMQYTFSRLFSPPALNSGSRAPVYVEVVNGTDDPDLALLAADNLSWYGFAPIITDADRDDYETTTISYYGDNLKGASGDLLSWLFSQRESDVELIPDTPYDYDYRVVLGADYDPCVNHLFAPG
ncbi:MAG: LCP family protein [Chloroflexota bacterium]